MDAMGTVTVEVNAKVRRIKRTAALVALAAFLIGTVSWSVDLGALVAYRHVSPFLIAWPVLVALSLIVWATVWLPATVSIRRAEREYGREYGRLMRYQAYLDRKERESAGQ